MIMLQVHLIWYEFGGEMSAAAAIDHFDAAVYYFVFWDRFSIEYAASFNVDYGCDLSARCRFNRR